MNELNANEVESVVGGRNIVGDLLIGVASAVLTDGIVGIGLWIAGKAHGGADDST